MKTITFKGESERIKTNGDYTSVVISGYSDKIVTPLIHFVYLDGENDSEPVELNFSYEVLYSVEIYFETVTEHECTLTYQLIK